MNKHQKIFLAWLALVFLWNFGYPGAEPIYDVVAAVVLSAGATLLKKKA